MKHLIILLYVFCTSMNAFANVEPNVDSKLKNAFKMSLKSEDLIQASDGHQQIQPQCRVCCTITTYDYNGNAKSFTACAGNFLTNCETAGTNACNRARLQATLTLF